MVQFMLNIASILLHFYYESIKLGFSIPQILFWITMVMIGLFTLWRDSRLGSMIFIILSVCLSLLLIFYEVFYHRDFYTKRESSVGMYLFNALHLAINIVLIILSGMVAVYFYRYKNIIIRKTELGGYFSLGWE